MKAQHGPSGYVSTEPFPVGPSEPRIPARSTGTPLGRIVAGVFLGLLAWSVLLVVIGIVLVATVLTSVEHRLDGSAATPSSGTSALSVGCRSALRDGDDGTSSACAADDSSVILAYLAAH